MTPGVMVTVQPRRVLRSSSFSWRMVVTSTMSFMVVVSLSGGTWADRASPGAAASLRGCREEGEFSTTPHEDRLARGVAPLERKRIGGDADDDAFPPSVLHPDGREDDAADADFIPTLRSRGPTFWVGWRGRRWTGALVTRGRRSVARDRTGFAAGASLRGRVAAPCELDELAEHGSARKRRKRPTARKHAPRCELAGYRLLLLRLDPQNAHFHQVGGFASQARRAGIKPRRPRLPGVVTAKHDHARLGLVIGSNHNGTVHQRPPEMRRARRGALAC